MAATTRAVSGVVPVVAADSALPRPGAARLAWTSYRSVGPDRPIACRCASRQVSGWSAVDHRSRAVWAPIPRPPTKTGCPGGLTLSFALIRQTSWAPMTSRISAGALAARTHPAGRSGVAPMTGRAPPCRHRSARSSSVRARVGSARRGAPEPDPRMGPTAAPGRRPGPPPVTRLTRPLPTRPARRARRRHDRWGPRRRV